MVLVLPRLLVELPLPPQLPVTAVRVRLAQLLGLTACGPMFHLEERLCPPPQTRTLDPSRKCLLADHLPASPRRERSG